MDMDTTPWESNGNYNDYLGPIEYQREEMEDYMICFEDMNVNQMHNIRSYHHRFYYFCMTQCVKFTLNLYGQPSIPLNWFSRYLYYFIKSMGFYRSLCDVFKLVMVRRMHIHLKWLFGLDDKIDIFIQSALLVFWFFTDIHNWSWSPCEF